MRAVVGVVFLIVAAVAPAMGEEIVLDLADSGATMIVAPGTEVSFKVIHRLPGGSYRFEAQRIGFLAPLSLDGIDPESLADEPALTPECARLLDSLDDAISGSSERALRATLLSAEARSPSADCTRRIGVYRSGTETALTPKLTVGEGQTIVIVVTRDEPQGAEPWRWRWSSVPVGPALSVPSGSRANMPSASRSRTSG